MFDRGYASGYWLTILVKYHARFVIRWIGRHVFLTLAGEEKKLWEIGRGKKYRAHKEIWDTITGEKMPVDLWWTALRHPQSGQPLFLVKARVKKGVMYLLTNDPVETEAQAWEVFFSYRRRWQIETSFRYEKSELAVQSVRLWEWENREKLLLMVTLAYAFLLSLLDLSMELLRTWILRQYCHRTGKRCREATAPLYRLRWALSRFWNDFHPIFCFTVLQTLPIGGNP